MNKKIMFYVMILFLVVGIALVGVSLFSYGTIWYPISRVGSIALLFFAYLIHIFCPKDK